MDLTAVAIVLGLGVCVVFAIVPAVRILISDRPRPHDDADDDGPQDGGGGPRRPHEPWLRPGPDAPAWWPEFERDFARYVAARDPARRTNGPPR